MKTQRALGLVLSIGCADGVAQSTAPIDEDGNPTGSGLVLQSLSQGQCSALAPEGWRMITEAPYQYAELHSPDDKMNADWIGLPVNRSLQGIYADQLGDLNADPATVLQTMANFIVLGLNGTPEVQISSQEISLGENGFYQARTFESSTHMGMVMYHLFDMFTLGPYVEGQNYIVTAYMGIVERGLEEEYGVAVMQIAGSIACTTQLQLNGSGGSSDSGGSDGETLGCDEYNVQLETQYFCDSNGTNYLLNPNEDCENGNSDECYRSLPGGGSEQLTPGRCDC